MKRRDVMIGAAAAAVASLVFPPWARVAPSGVVVERAYAPLFAPPDYSSIDPLVLGAQLAALAIVAGAGWALTRSD